MSVVMSSVRMLIAIVAVLGLAESQAQVGRPQKARAALPGENGLIAFVRDVSTTINSNPEIHVMEADGSNVTRLTNSPGADILPAWSPDGTRIAFASDRDGAGNPDVGLVERDIFVMNANGSGQTNLTLTPDVDELHPAWSADGQIVFWRRADVSDPSELVRMDADGSNATVLPLTGSTLGHAVSPDDATVAYVSGSFLIKANFDGTGVVQIAQVRGAHNPDWSFDGERIVWGEIDIQQNPPRFDIKAVDAAGGRQTSYTQEGTQRPGLPTANR